MKRQSRFGLCLTCLRARQIVLLLSLALPLGAAGPWSLPLFTSDPRTVLAAAARYSPPEDADALVLDYAVHVQIDESGRMRKTTRTVARILRIQGVREQQVLSVVWLPWREDRPRLRARVITPDGKVHLLKEDAMVDKDLPSALGDVSSPEKNSFASLPGVDIDSVVETEIEQKDREIALPGGRWGQITPRSKSLIEHFSARVEAPAKLELRVSLSAFSQVRRSESVEAGIRQITVDSTGISPARVPILLPPDVARTPAITFSTAPSWQAAARWYAPIINAGAGISKSAPPPPDQVTTIEKVFEEVQSKVRDTGVQLGAAPYKPRAPADTWKSGIADSKDKAVLLISKLAEAGIHAEAALLTPAPAPDILPDVPGLEAFSRMLVYVPDPNPLWIDPAAQVNPVTILPIADQGRWALILDSSAANLVRTPQTSAAENRQIESVEIQLQDGGVAQVKKIVEAHGALEEQLRSTLQSIAAAAERGDTVTDRLADFANMERVTKYDVGEPKHLLAPCKLQITGEGYSDSHLTDEGGFIGVPGPATLNFLGFSGLFRAIKNNDISDDQQLIRKEDYFLPPPFTQELRYHIVPPAGYRVKEPAGTGSVSLGPLSFSIAAKQESDGSLRLTYTLVSPRARYKPQEIVAFVRDFQKLPRERSISIQLFNVAEEKLAAGDLKQGIALLQHDAASSTNATLRLASAYVDAGARTEAVKLCRQIISKDPKNAAAYGRLGWVYSHDEFGRLFAPGMDMANAEQAYLKAIELAPENKLYRLQLARLYTYNSSGVPYGSSARITDAAERYGEVGLRALARQNALNEYATALLVLNRYSEIEQTFAYSEEGAADPAFKIAAIAAKDGVSDAKDEAAFIAGAPEKERSLLLQAARYLLLSRNYKPAVDLLQAAGPAQSIPAADLRRIARAHKFDESAVSKQPAIAAFQRFVTAVFSGADPRPTSYRSELLNIVKRPMVPEQSISWPFYADILTTAMTFEVDGSDTTGFRIRMAVAAPAKPKTLGYVVRRGDTYLVLGLNGVASSTGEALARVEAGDLEGARQWLEWAKEEMLSATPETTTASILRLWAQQKSAGSADLVKAAAASLAALGPDYDRGIAALDETRGRITDSAWQLLMDQSLGQALFAHGRYAEALPVLRRLRGKWPPAEAELIETLIKGKLQEAAAIEVKICAHPKATAFDWNNLAWLGLFTEMPASQMLAAAERSTHLDTLALVQAATGHLEEARNNAYRLAEMSAGPDEIATVFGRIAEELQLPAVAAGYYSRVRKQEPGATLSNYAFAQMRLHRLSATM
jgi:tetratricopeptide (TPR) repeat protein